jgi:hypothetical protein
MEYLLFRRLFDDDSGVEVQGLGDFDELAHVDAARVLLVLGHKRLGFAEFFRQIDLADSPPLALSYKLFDDGRVSSMF